MNTEIQVMEIEKLEQSIMRVVKTRNIANEKALLLWGGRTYTWTQEIMPKLARQMKWLDANEGDEKYEDRFDQWEILLKSYTRACNALIAAYSYVPEVTV